MNLLWKVGTQYYLCGEGADGLTFCPVPKGSLRPFLPVFDITEGVRFTVPGWFQVESMRRDGAAAGESGKATRLDRVRAHEEECVEP